MSDAKLDAAANDRRTFLGGGIVGLAAGSIAALAGGSIAALAGGQAQADTPPVAEPKRVGLFPAEVRAADAGYSPGLMASGHKLIAVSGQGSADIKADMETQMRETFERIGRVLAEAGASFEHVVMMRAYFVHLSRDLPAYRKVRKEFLKKPYPASTAVGTTELAIPGLDIEIEAIAVL